MLKPKYYFIQTNLIDWFPINNSQSLTISRSSECFIFNVWWGQSETTTKRALITIRGNGNVWFGIRFTKKSQLGQYERLIVSPRLGVSTALLQSAASEAFSSLRCTVAILRKYTQISFCRPRQAALSSASLACFLVASFIGTTVIPRNAFQTTLSLLPVFADSSSSSDWAALRRCISSVLVSTQNQNHDNEQDYNGWGCWELHECSGVIDSQGRCGIEQGSGGAKMTGTES